MRANYSELFNLAYSTAISESVKDEIINHIDLPICESEIEISENIYEGLYFLDELAYSNMSEGVVNDIIDRVFEGCSEEYLEEVYEAYVKFSALAYISEDSKFIYGPDGKPVGSYLRTPRAVQDILDKAKRRADRKAKVDRAISSVKGAVKDAAIAAGNKATEIGKNISNTATAAKNSTIEAGKRAKEATVNKATQTANSLKKATEPARDIASYTAHRAAEGGKSLLNKVKGAVGKVKDWWNDYTSRAKAYGDARRQPKYYKSSANTNNNPAPKAEEPKTVQDYKQLNLLDQKPAEVEAGKKEEEKPAEVETGKKEEESVEEKPAEEPAPKRRGRPKGSKNKNKNVDTASSKETASSIANSADTENAANDAEKKTVSA